MPSDRRRNGWDDSVELVDAPGRGSKADPPEYSSPRTGHATNASASATTPFIENPDNPELTEQDTITVLRTVQFIARFVIGAFLYIVQLVVVGLAANGMSNLSYVHEDAQMAIGVLAVAGFIEVVWLAIMPFLLCCCYYPVTFMSLGLIGVEALGTSVYTLAVVGQSMRSSACADQRAPERCQDALNKGLAAACVRIVITVPICLGITALAIVLQRRGSSGRAPEEGLMGWSLLILGKISKGQS